jgi:hypothetical protein
MLIKKPAPAGDDEGGGGKIPEWHSVRVLSAGVVTSSSVVPTPE